MLKLLNLSFSALKERKLRAAITILMVVIGVSLITGLNGMSNGVNQYIVDQFSSLGANVVIVMPGGIRGGSSVKITDETVTLLNTIPEVKAVTPYISEAITITSSGLSNSIQLLGLDHDKLKLIYPRLKLKEGELGDSNNPTILLGHDVAHPPGEDTPFASVGQVVSVEYTRREGLRVITEKRTFIVRGILDRMGAAGMLLSVDRIAFIPVSAANSFFERGGKYDGLYIIAVNEDVVDIVVDRIQELLGRGVTIVSAQSLLETIRNIMGTIQLYLGSVASVSLIVAAVGIFAALYTSVLERTREIGILKAIGFKSAHVMMLFLGEALLIGFIGGAVGNVVGIALAYMLGMFLPSIQAGHPSGIRGPDIGASQPKPLIIDPIFTIDMLLMVWVFSIILSIFAGVYPAWRASRLDPVVALRKE